MFESYTFPDIESEEDKRLRIALNEMALTIRRWLDWNKDERDREGLETTDGTHIIALPVSYWPSRGALTVWAETLEQAAKHLTKG